MKPPLGINSIIDHMLDRHAIVVKTLTKRGPVYTFSDNLQVVPRPTAEKMIRCAILVDQGDAEQTFRLSDKWGRENA